MILLPTSTDIVLVLSEEPPNFPPEDALVFGLSAPEATSRNLALPAVPEPGPAPTETSPVVLLDTLDMTEPASASLVPRPEEPAAVAAAPEPAAAVPEAAPPPVAPDVATPPEAALLPITPAFAVPAEDAFPTLAELDAILAANAGPPPGPGAAERAEVVALLGLDPAIADDPALYAETLANLPDPDADLVLEQWMREYGVEDPQWDPEEPAGDWQFP